MQKRQFFQLAAVSAAAVLGLSACGEKTPPQAQAPAAAATAVVSEPPRPSVVMSFPGLTT